MVRHDAIGQNLHPSKVSHLPEHLTQDLLLTITKKEAHHSPSESAMITRHCPMSSFAVFASLRRCPDSTHSCQSFLPPFLGSFFGHARGPPDGGRGLCAKGQSRKGVPIAKFILYLDRSIGHLPAMEIVEHEGISHFTDGPAGIQLSRASGAGARLMNWNLRMADGSVRDVIHWPEGADYDKFPAVRGGNPILFPFGLHLPRWRARQMAGSARHGSPHATARFSETVYSRSRT